MLGSMIESHFRKPGQRREYFQELLRQASNNGKIFQPSLAEEIALTWGDALTNLISAAVTGDFSQGDEIVFSHDRQKAFRLFVSKSILYFDKSETLDVYVIPTLKLGDVGDPKNDLFV
jgi:hypothetical protein